MDIPQLPIDNRSIAITNYPSHEFACYTTDIVTVGKKIQDIIRIHKLVPDLNFFDFL